MPGEGYQGCVSRTSVSVLVSLSRPRSSMACSSERGLPASGRICRKACRACKQAGATYRYTYKVRRRGMLSITVC